MTPPYDVVTVGNFTRDTIATRAGERFVDGGGFNYAAHAAVASGARTAAVTRLAREHAAVVGALEAEGVTVLPTWTPSSTLMRLEYPGDNVDERVLTVAATAGSFEPGQVAGLASRAFVVSPSLRGEVGLDVLRELRRPDVLVAIDLQGFLRVRRDDGVLEHKPWPEAAETLALADVVKTDAVEAESLTGESDMRRAARAVAAYGVSEVVLTHRGGLLVLADGVETEASWVPRALVGRSGRGDTCLGSYTARRLRAEPAEACLWAVAVTSLKMEAEGPIRRGSQEIEATFASLVPALP